MKPQGRIRKTITSLFLSTIMVSLMVSGCKKKNPTEPSPAPTRTKTAVNTAVPTSTRTNTPVVVLTNTPVVVLTNTPTATSVPTGTFTSTSVPPTETPTDTATSVPPTITPTTPPSGLAAVDLGASGSFVILAKSGITTTGTTSIVGNMGVSPIDSTAMTGFGLIMDASGTFATSSLVTGNIYAADYTPPTPGDLTTAVSDMEAAYTDAAGRPLPDQIDLGAGNISGMTLNPGLYKWGTALLIDGTGVTLDCLGNGNAVYIFQLGGALDVASAGVVTLSGGCQAKNIFWQVPGAVTLGTTSDFKGVILSSTAINLLTGAVLNGRALAQTAVTLDANPVTESN